PIKGGGAAPKASGGGWFSDAWDWVKKQAAGGSEGTGAKETGKSGETTQGGKRVTSKGGVYESQGDFDWLTNLLRDVKGDSGAAPAPTFGSMSQAQSEQAWKAAGY